MPSNTAQIFQPFLETYKMTPIAGDFYITIEKYLRGEMTKPVLYQYVMLNGQFELSDFSKITSELNRLLAQGGPVTAVRGRSAGQIDVPESERSQDQIFHELLDYVRAQKLERDLERRLFNVFLSYFKNIRDENETRETLSKELALGGLAFDITKSDEVANKFKEIMQEIQDRGIKTDDLANWFRDHYSTTLLNTTMPVSTSAPIPAKPAPKLDHDLDQPLPQHIKMHQQEIEAMPEISAPTIKPSLTPAPAKPAAPAAPVSTASEITKIEKKPVVASGLPSPVKRVVPEAVRQQIAAVPTVPVPAPAKPAKKSLFGRLFKREPKPEKASTSPMPQVPPQIQPQPQAAPSGRPTLDDITYAPRLFGPVEELSSLTLSDFRRLAKDPTVAANKIKAKIDLLAHESLDRRAAGVAALMKSELYRQYSDIMNASVLQGRPFTEILAAKNTISEPEFRALMQLNKELRS